jgi:hypothetical protein
MTNAELVQQWQDGEKRQKQLWQEILHRGLYFQVLGVNPDRKDSAWRNPPSATLQSEREFYDNVVGSPRRYYRHNKQQHVITQKELAEFE